VEGVPTLRDRFAIPVGIPFTIGDTTIEAEAGQILIGPAGVPHKFVNLGPGLLDTTDIHLSDSCIQTNLDEPE
jgi:mannose-6-phosphate isomerase-like protein (cupin superfamily)